MGNEVFANGMEIACKSGNGKVIAAFPDVCLSPPSPPAGPIPVPYPDTSFSRDMKNGSKTVKIDGKEVGLKNKSFYKTSPLGDEAATRSFGANVLTHTITGKTYFIAWSMDIKAEGQNVARHIDMTTSNHASYPGGTGPMVNTEDQELALLALIEDQCPCCQEKSCTAALSKDVTNPDTGNTEPRTPWSFREWYRLDETDGAGNLTDLAKERRQKLADNACTGTGVTGDPCPNASKGPEDRKADPPCDVYRVLTLDESRANEAGIDSKKKRELRDHHQIPVSQDVFAQRFFAANPAARGVLGGRSPSFANRSDLKNHLTTRPTDPMSQKDADRWIQDQVQIDHVTPRAAGGCPTAIGNTRGNSGLCENCQKADKLLDTWSGTETENRRP